MAVVQVRSRRNRGGGQPGESASQRILYIEVDDPADNQYTIAASGMVPVVGSTHPSDANAYCNDVEFDPHEDSWRWWTGTFSYTTKISKEDKEKWEQTPLDRALKIVTRFGPYEKYTLKDRDGKAILNSAGDPPVDPIPVPATRMWFECAKNLTSYPSFMFTLKDRVNAAPLTIRGYSCDAGTLLFRPGEVGDIEEEGGILFVTATWVLDYDEDGWQYKLLEQGFRAKYPLPIGRIPILIDGVQPSEPVLLDSDGTVLADPSPDTAVFTEKLILKEGNFAVLPSS